MKPGDLVKLHASVVYTYTYDFNKSEGKMLNKNNAPDFILLLDFSGCFGVKRCKVLFPSGKITYIDAIHLEAME